MTAGQIRGMKGCGKRAYEASVHVKTCENPHERTCASGSLGLAWLIVRWRSRVVEVWNCLGHKIEPPTIAKKWRFPSQPGNKMITSGVYQKKCFSQSYTR